MPRFGEDFKAFRIIAWLTVHLNDGRIRLMPYLDVFNIKELNVARIGNSSHCLKNLATTLSELLATHVLLRFAMVKCQERLDSTK